MTTEKEPWSVWFANVRFSDGNGSKDRPVVVLNDNTVLCLCLPVTSKEKSRSLDYFKIRDHRSANLEKESWVKFELIELRPSDFRRQIGMLDDGDIFAIQAWLMSRRYGQFADI